MAHDKTHLDVGKTIAFLVSVFHSKLKIEGGLGSLAPDAIARAEREGLKGYTLVISEFRVARW